MFNFLRCSPAFRFNISDFSIRFSTNLLCSTHFLQINSSIFLARSSIFEWRCRAWLQDFWSSIVSFHWSLWHHLPPICSVTWIRLFCNFRSFPFALYSCLVSWSCGDAVMLNNTENNSAAPGAAMESGMECLIRPSYRLGGRLLWVPFCLVFGSTYWARIWLIPMLASFSGKSLTPCSSVCSLLQETKRV